MRSIPSSQGWQELNFDSDCPAETKAAVTPGGRVLGSKGSPARICIGLHEQAALQHAVLLGGGPREIGAGPVGRNLQVKVMNPWPDVADYVVARQPRLIRAYELTVGS